jgi:DNA invertase Pin-like site-specific DNA recombinase
VSAKHSTNERPVRAAAYYRVSTTRQEDSIDRQRSQVAPYAPKHGYEIVQEYTDEGIPGNEVERRKAFRRLLADPQAGKFACILCDDKDRFGRFDSIEYGYHVKPLRDAGAWRETVAQGKLDWHSFAVRISDTVQQEGKQMEAQAISRRVLTQFLNLARQGRFLGSPVPYGYRLEVETAARGQRVAGTSRLIPGEAREVETVRLIFRLYGADGLSIEDVCNDLYRRGVSSPRGLARWSKQSVAHLLANRRYVGDMPWNAGSKAKYTEMEGGQLRQYGRRAKQWRRHESADFIVATDTHEALIDRDLFERVQWRLAANRHGSAVPEGVSPRKRSPKKPGPKTGRKRCHYALGGLLICANCGARMAGFTMPSGEVRYHCNAYSNYGKAVCTANTVKEATIKSKVLAYIEREVLNPDGLAELHERRRREYERLKKEAPAVVDGLRRQATDLTAEIDGSTVKLAVIAEVDPEGVRHHAATIRGWREQRERIEKEITEALRPSDLVQLGVAVEQIRAYLGRLRDLMDGGDPRRVRLLLADLIDRIELSFTARKAGKQVRSQFTEGVIYVRPQVGFVTSQTQGRL